MHDPVTLPMPDSHVPTQDTAFVRKKRTGHSGYHKEFLQLRQRRTEIFKGLQDPPLVALVRPFIHDNNDWKDLIKQFEIHDSVPQTEKQPHELSSKNGHKMRP